MEALQKSRTDLFISINREFNVLEGAVKEELARCTRNAASATERQKLEHEVETIRSQVSKASLPCTENEELQRSYERRWHNDRGSVQQTDQVNGEVESLHEAAAVRHRVEEQAGLTVPYRDYAALRDKYNALIQQCVNLHKANDKAIAKWKEGKEQIRTWRAYHERSMLKQRTSRSGRVPEKKASATSTKIVKELGVDTERHAIDQSREHNPNTPIGGFGGALENGAKSPMSLGGSLMPSLPSGLMSSPPTRAASLPRGLANPSHNLSNKHSNKHVSNHTGGKLSEGAHFPGICRRPNDSETFFDRAEETQGEGRDIIELPTPKAKDGFRAITGGILRPNSSGHSSDPPVVVSERSLKRKRPLSAGKSVIIFDDRADIHGVGDMAKPIYVKSEQCSSSPIYASGARENRVVHDSLDLDEVGARLITPRKRRRLQELLRLSQAGVPSVDVGVDKQQGRPTSRPTEGIEAHDSDAVLRGTKDHDIIGERFGIALEPKEQGKAEARRLAQGVLDASVPKELRGTHNQKRARQWLHNREAHLRRVSRTNSVSISKDVASLAAQDRSVKRIDHRQPTWQDFKADEQPIRSFSEPPDAGASQRHPLERVAVAKAGGTKALQPTNPNVQILPRTSEAHSLPKRQVQRMRRDRGAARVYAVADDGDGHNGSDLRVKSKVVSNTHDAKTETLLQHNQDKANLQVHKRLVNLLDEPSPQKPRLSPEDLPPRASKSSSRSPSKPTAHPRAREKAANYSGKLQTRAAISEIRQCVTEHHRDDHNLRQAEAKSVEDQDSLTTGSYPGLYSDHEPGVVLPEHEPYRARPVNRLGPDHFKVNSGYNQGIDYAFSEVVRKHEQRKCLPGCMRQDCCGAKFRKLVELGGLPTPQRPGLWGSSPTNDAEDDQYLLADYLGEDHGRLEQMMEDERRELLLEAKSRYFADKHGRHRQAYERRSTPPGFWRTEMPTTQEAEEDREAARKMERQKVEEMYREAMRPGGRWTFRDEY
ncbi:MAG: Peroxisomal membrane protein pex16 [Pleopsidium flavum]|nr:MAG: Peroxisomal membrane protein pex16 [Pleopsidium flavum]